MKKIIFSLPLFALILSACGTSAWVTFKSSFGKFQIDAPGQLKTLSEQTTNQVQSGQYSYADKNGDNYMAQSITYPANMISDPKNFVETAAKGYASATGVKLINSNAVTFEGSSAGYDAVIFNESQGTYLYSRYLIFGNTMYTLVLSTKEKDSKNATKYFNSFKLIK